MTMYEAEMTWTETRNFTAIVPIEVPDDIPEDKIEEWIEDNIWNEADPYSFCDDDASSVLWLPSLIVPTILRRNIGSVVVPLPRP